jgi:hypothetical protein
MLPRCRTNSDKQQEAEALGDISLQSKAMNACWSGRRNVGR